MYIYRGEHPCSAFLLAPSSLNSELQSKDATANELLRVLLAYEEKHSRVESDNSNGGNVEKISFNMADLRLVIRICIFIPVIKTLIKNRSSCIERKKRATRIDYLKCTAGRYKRYNI